MYLVRNHYFFDLMVKSSDFHLFKTLFDIGFKDVKKCNPNEVIIYDLKTHKQLLKKSVKDFKLNQYKNHFEDWNANIWETLLRKDLKMHVMIFYFL